MIDPSQSTAARIWFRFMRIKQRCQAVMTLRLREIGLSIAQFDLMSTLSEAEGITQRDLAEKLYVTKGNVSGLVDRLVEAGLVLRKGIPGDRRSYALYLTGAGRGLVEQGMAVQMNFVQETIGALPKSDIEQLDSMLVIWRDKLRTMEGRSGRGTRQP